MRDVHLPVYGKEGVSRIVAHKEDMLLIDSVLSFSGWQLEAEALMDASSPFFRDGGTPSYVAFELIAQVIGVFSYLSEYTQNADPDIGFILNVSDFRMYRDSFREDERVRITVNLDCNLGNGIFNFRGKVSSSGETVAEGSVLAMSVPDPVAVLRGITDE